jgi:hypothetical protein
MAHSEGGKWFYGGGDMMFGLVFLLNTAAIGGPASLIGWFLVARGTLTMMGIS